MKHCDWRGWAGLALASALAGCQAAGADRVSLTPPAPEASPPPPVVVEVTRPPRPDPARAVCVPRTLRAAPRYPDSDAALRAAPGAADRYQLMAAGRLLRQRRLEELERVVAGCR